MRASHCVGRIGELALALGVGTLLTVAAAGPAWAGPDEAGDSPGTRSATRDEAAPRQSRRTVDREPRALPDRRSSAPRQRSPEPDPERPLPAAALREPIPVKAPAPAVSVPSSVPAPAPDEPGVFPERTVPTAADAAADSTPARVAQPVMVAAPARTAVAIGAVESGPSPLRGAGTGAPVQSPMSWVMLAAARRELDSPGAAQRMPAATVPTEPAPDTEGAISAAAASATPTNPITAIVEQIQGFVTQVVTAITQVFNQVVQVVNQVVTAIVNIFNPGPANTAPNGGIPIVGAPDAASGVVTGSVSASDPDGDTLTYSAPATTAEGAVVIDPVTGEFTYTPTTAARHAAAGIGAVAADLTDSFTVTVSDGHGGITSVEVTATIAPLNAAPTAGIPTYGADPDTGVVTGTVNAVDPDGDPLTYGPLATETTKGVVAVTNTGSFTYTPTELARQNAAASTATSADRTDAFTVSVSDRFGATTTVMVSVPVVPSGTQPIPETGHMAVGMNLENVVDWSPAWTFTDAFKASRPWISHSFNPQTWQLTWNPDQAPTLDLDADGNVRSLKTWEQNGIQMKQYAGTLMFDSLDGGYAAGIYHAQWDGTGVVSFGMDAVVTATGRTEDGRNFAELAVTPTNNGIYLRIEETSAADPVRNINVWMPDYNGQSFVGQRWQPGAEFSPFHPLFLSRLSPFGTLRFMGMQETNTSDVTTWSQRRDTGDIRQGSGAGGTPSEPIVNGISVEYMVALANELDADPWFNMPYLADDTFVRNFATYVSRNLEPGRTVYVEWANEVWNFGWGFEASHWVAEKARTADLDPDYGQWIVAGQEAERDLTIWSEVFATQSALQLVRVAAGWAAVDWVTNQIAENMDGAFDAIAIAPYITPTDEQRAAYTASTSVDRVIADTRANIATSAQWVADHEELARQWSQRLGRPIDLVAYEGGAHLDGRGATYQNAFYTATNDSRMGDIYRDYLKALDAAGLDLYVDFQFTGQAGAAPWGDFAKLHRMDEPLTGAHRYNAVLAAADGSLWPVL